MTIPGVIQAVLILACTISSFVWYFKRKNSILSLVFYGLCLSMLGIVVISTGPFSPESLNEIWSFQAKDFYYGIVVYCLGVGVIVGSLAAWVTCLVKGGN